MIDLLFNDYIENKTTSDELRTREKRTREALIASVMSKQESDRVETFIAEERLQAEEEAFKAGFKACKLLIEELQ